MLNHGPLTLVNTTIGPNFSPFATGGGGLHTSGPLSMVSTIIAHNRLSDGTPNDCQGVITSDGHNLIGNPTGCTIALQPTARTGDLGLDTFVDAAIPGRSHFPLLASSQAIDAGDDEGCTATDQLGNPRVGPCDIGAIEFQPRASAALVLRLNQTTFRPGETLWVDVHAKNPGQPTTTDFYLAVLLPDGVSVLFITNLAPLDDIVTMLSAPHTFRPLAAPQRPTGDEVSLPDFFTYTFHGLETPGTYHLIVALTPVGAFNDDSIDDGDILALDWEALHFSSGASQNLYATMQAIRARHLAQAGASLGAAD